MLGNLIDNCKQIKVKSARFIDERKRSFLIKSITGNSPASMLEVKGNPCPALNESGIRGGPAAVTGDEHYNATVLFE